MLPKRLTNEDGKLAKEIDERPQKSVGGGRGCESRRNMSENKTLKSCLKKSVAGANPDPEFKP
jgi:hypothetical protein